MMKGVGAKRRHRHSTSRAGRGRRTALRALVVVLLGLWAALGAGTLTAGAADGDTVKVFVVGDPAQRGGQADTLQSIATSTLGDANRSGEIFDLNRGQAQQDGTALNDPGDTLHPGWILRLPPDASGPDVQQAKETGTGTGTGTDPRNSAPPAATPAPPAAGSGTATAPADSGAISVPLPAVLAALGALVLALVTAGIVGRRQVRRAFAALGRRLRKFGDPARRKRRLQFRRALSSRFASDADSVRGAYGVLAEFAARKGKRETPVHALRVDSGGVTAWLPASEEIPTPWQNVGGTLWRRPAGAASWLTPGSAGTDLDTLVASACLVRVGTDHDGEPVFVDLSRLDGTLSVTGDHAVARDVVGGLLAEIARTRPGLPVSVLRGTDGAPPIPVPPGLEEVTRIDEGLRRPRPGSERATVRAAASRRPVKGLVVMAGTPTDREAAELLALCGPGGAGWTGLVCGEVGGAHWRWHTDPDGNVEIPVLGVTLTVPA
jgi:hypothetical protein